MPFACLSPLLLLTALLAAPAETVRWQGDVLLDQQFEAASDVDFDHWPDGWTRRRGPEFPSYLPLSIVSQLPASGERCMQLKLDGGGAAVMSPPQHVDARFNYLLSGRMRTAGLLHDAAWISIAFYDDQQQLISTVNTTRHTQADDWLALQLGPLQPPAAAHHAVVGLHLEPRSPPQFDLKGAALFDDLRLVRLPRLSLTSSTAGPWHTLGEPLSVECHATGLGAAHRLAEVELVDAAGATLAAEQLLLIDAAPGQLTRASASVVHLAALADSGDPREARLSWSPPVLQAGYYRARVSIPLGDGVAARSELSIVAAPADSTPPAAGPFGWNLVDAPALWDDPHLVQLLQGSGVGWVKLPLWLDAADRAALSQRDKLVERLYRQHVEVVGVLDRPPNALSEQLQLLSAAPIASVLRRDAASWYPSLEPVLMKMLFRVRHWQLGSDDDRSFAGYSQAAATVAATKQQLDAIGQNLDVGIGSSWDDSLRAPSSDIPPWQFVALSSPAGQTPEELAALLQRPAAARRWVNIEPLPRTGHTAEQRAADLVLRLLAAHEHGAERIGISRPLDAEHGLLHPNGDAAELLLPWRTSVRALNGSMHRGALHLPEQSHSALLRRGDALMLIAWSDTPRRETLYLGEQVEVENVWGQRQAVESQSGRQTIEVGPVPVVVHGLHPAITAWRQSIVLEGHQLPSILGRPHPLAVQWTNTFPTAVQGQVHFRSPDGWRVQPPRADLRLEPGERFEQALQITLPVTASTGHRALWLEFELTADRPHRFIAYEPMQIGTGDVTLDVETVLNEQGELEVKQRLTNHTADPVSFRCLLFVPNRRREMWQVTDLPRGHEAHTNLLPDGGELLGQTLWLRAEEIGGRRTISHRFTAEE